MKKLSVIVLNYNTADMTHKTVMTFAAHEPSLDYEMIVVDNGSTETLTEFNDQRVTLIRSEKNLGFAAGVNLGMRGANGEYILLLNSDMLISEAAVSRMIDYMDTQPSVGIIGPQFCHPSGSFQPSSGKFPTIWREFLRFSMLGKMIPGGTLSYPAPLNNTYFTEARQVDWVSGGCMLIRKKLIDQIGGLDEHFFFGVEDFDFCYRAKIADAKVVYFPQPTVIHYHGFSSGGPRATLMREAEGMNYFFNKHLPHKRALRIFVSILYTLRIKVLSFLYKPIPR